MPAFVPTRGDIVWLQFGDSAGHEQSGRRPALVLSDRRYNGKVGLALVVPITSRVKGYSWEVAIPEGSKAKGAVLADHVRSVDWRARKAKRLCPAPEDLVRTVTAKLRVLLDPEGGMTAPALRR